MSQNGQNDEGVVTASTNIVEEGAKGGERGEEEWRSWGEEERRKEETGARRGEEEEEEERPTGRQRENVGECAYCT